MLFGEDVIKERAVKYKVLVKYLKDLLDSNEIHIEERIRQILMCLGELEDGIIK